ncbi:MAG TPA: cytochrome c-type biogenesis protein CcmH [Anaerolineales bacterium]|nr:cytochrome c-type biogenesis protein CcmH [Anaerolineales bacterium]
MRILSVVLPLLGLLLFGAFLSVDIVQAQEPTPSDDQVNAIANGLYCPVCENIPLDVCPTQACEQWRAVIRQKLADGWSKEQIEQYFVSQYGDRVLASPPARGLNWLVYVLPPLAFLLGAFVLFRFFRSWRASSPAPATSPPAPIPNDDPYLARLEDEVKKRA